MIIDLEIEVKRGRWNRDNPGFPATHLILGSDEEAMLCAFLSINQLEPILAIKEYRGLTILKGFAGVTIIASGFAPAPLLGEPYDYPQKPPLGIMPRCIWLEHRRDELLGAITRHSNPGPIRNYKQIAEWAQEYAGICLELEEAK